MSKQCHGRTVRVIPCTQYRDAPAFWLRGRLLLRLPIADTKDLYDRFDQRKLGDKTPVGDRHHRSSFLQTV